MELNKDILLDFLKKEFPYKYIEFIGGCWSSIAFVADDLIIRFPKNSLEMYEVEARILPFIKNKITFQIPDVKINKSSKFPHAYHKMIEGSKWTLEDTKTLSEEKFNSLAYDCANFFYQIHQVSVEDIKKIVPNIKSHHKTNVIPKDELWTILKQYLSMQKFENLYSNYQNTTLYNTTNLIFSHGDFSGSNSLINKNAQLIGIFDWASSGIEEREYEFFRFWNDDNKFLDKVINYYEKLSGIKINKARIKERFLLDNINILYAIHTREYLFSTKDQRMGWLLKNFEEFC